MTSAQHRQWNASGLQWRLAYPLVAVRDDLRAKGYTVYDIGNDNHMDHDPPEDHTPYSETGYPGKTPYGWVTAIDIMPNSRLESLQVLGLRFKNGRNSGVYPWLKYMNWGPRDDYHAIHSSWQPDYAETSSTDTGHIHLSCYSTYTQWEGDVMELSGRSLEVLNNLDRQVNAILSMAPSVNLLNNGKESPWTNKLASAVLAGATVMTDEQIKNLAQLLHAEQDGTTHDEFSIEAVETALRNVLRKGVDNAG